GEDLLTLEVEDADSAVLKQGGFWGTLTLAPTREFYRQALNLSDAQARSMEDLSFRMQLSNDKTSATAHIAALWQGTEEYASVDCGVALKPAGALSVETSRLESSEWLRGFSEDKINAWISDLRSAGVPEELTEQLAQTLMLLVWMNR
ncbi:MAG: hypothetical protein IJ705_05905, partial [Oscillospiraceae bacterium]|nr:hypothetical protein [Oscillospiraceae bacterium]